MALLLAMSTLRSQSEGIVYHASSGGVGPMTVTMLLNNTIVAARRSLGPIQQQNSGLAKSAV